AGRASHVDDRRDVDHDRGAPLPRAGHVPELAGEASGLPPLAGEASGLPPRSQLMVPSAATSPALRWWASMRAVGLLGGRASSLDLDAAVDLLARGLRGRRRRRAVARRLGALPRELADRARDGELDPPAVADTLDRLLQVDVGDVGLDAAPV